LKISAKVTAHRSGGKPPDLIGEEMEAVLAQTTGFYMERPATGGLANAFSAIWVHRMAERDVPPIVITPDATIDLQWIDGRFRVAGPDKEPQIERPPAGALIVGLRFRPGAAAGWLGVPAGEIVGGRLELGDLWGTRARALSSRIKAMSDVAGMVRQLEETVGMHTQGRDAFDPLMGKAFEVIDGGLPPEIRLVPYLLGRLNMSERTLRRRFEDAFGYGPKTLDRILRFHRFRRLQKEAVEASTALLAIEAGYADQAHLIRESRRLTGVTPPALAGAPA
jgi:hypothetical protein